MSGAGGTMPAEQAGSLARGLAILQVLHGANRPMSLGDIAAAARLDQSTAHRLLRTMTDAGFVLRHARTRHYMASPAAYDPLPLLHPLNALRRDCRDLLARTAAQLPLTIVLVLFQADERVIVDIARQANTLVPSYTTWLSEPLHANASGKLLLAARSPAERAMLLAAAPMEAFAPNSLTSAAAVEADIAEVAQRGYATALEEIAEGMGAVAAPLRIDAATVGCVIAVGLSDTIVELGLPAVAAKLISLARLIPLQSGHLRAACQFLGD